MSKSKNPQLPLSRRRLLTGASKIALGAGVFMAAPAIVGRARDHQGLPDVRQVASEVGAGAQLVDDGDVLLELGRVDDFLDDLDLGVHAAAGGHAGTSTGAGPRCSVRIAGGPSSSAVAAGGTVLDPQVVEALVAAGLWRSRTDRGERRRRLAEALAFWQLEALQGRPLQALSGGELQRALLARLSLTEAPLLLLDEPEAALDETGRALFWHQVADWRAQGRTQLLVSHDLPRCAEHLRDGLLIAPAGCVRAPLRELGPGRRLGEVA